nr:MAG TPA: hypothetical protein [Caudoviricetes sp.]
MTKFKVVRYWDTYPDRVIATCDTEEEALIALFEKFKDKVKRKIEFFNKESKKLGIKQELRLL